MRFFSLQRKDPKALQIANETGLDYRLVRERQLNGWSEEKIKNTSPRKAIIQQSPTVADVPWKANLKGKYRWMG